MRIQKIDSRLVTTCKACNRHDDYNECFWTCIQNGVGKVSRNERPAPKIRRSEWSGAYIRFAFVRRRDRKPTRGNLTVGTSVGHYTVPHSLSFQPPVMVKLLRVSISIRRSHTCPRKVRRFSKVSRYRDPVCRFGEHANVIRHVRPRGAKSQVVFCTRCACG